MKASEIKGIAHDLLNLNDWKNPLDRVWIKEKFEFNLITGEANYEEKDSLHYFYRAKRMWFLKRISELKGDLKDFELAKIIVFGAKERIEIIYKGKKFSDEVVYHAIGREIKKLRQDIKKLNVERVKY